MSSSTRNGVTSASYKVNGREVSREEYKAACGGSYYGGAKKKTAPKKKLPAAKKPAAKKKPAVKKKPAAKKK